MPGTTKYTLGAYKVMPEIIEATKSNDSKVIVLNTDNAVSLRNSIYRQVCREGVKNRVVVAADGNMVFVRIKQRTRIDVLTEMCQKLMLHVDDENVYDEAMEVLYGKV